MLYLLIGITKQIHLLDDVLDEWGKIRRSWTAGFTYDTTVRCQHARYALAIGII